MLDWVRSHVQSSVLALVGISFAVLFLVWRVEVARRDRAELERDAARAEVARLTDALAGCEAARVEERTRCESVTNSLRSDVEVRDAILREWAGHAPVGSAGALLDRLLSVPGACLSDDLLPPAHPSD